MKRALPIIAIVAAALMGGCGGGPVSRIRGRMVYVDLDVLARRQPAWQQADTVAQVRRSLLLRAQPVSMPSPAVRMPAMPAATVVVQQPPPAVAERPETEEINAYRAGERARMEAFLAAERERLSAASDVRINAYAEAAEGRLRTERRAIAEKYSERLVNLRANVTLLRSRLEVKKGETLTPFQKADSDKLARLTAELAEVEKQRDQEAEAAERAVRQEIARETRRAKEEVDQQMAGLRAEQQERLAARVAERERQLQARSPEQQEFERSLNVLVEPPAAPRTSIPPAPPAATGWQQSARRTAAQLAAQERGLRAVARHDTERMAREIAERSGATVAFRKATGLPDRTAEFDRLLAQSFQPPVAPG